MQAHSEFSDSSRFQDWERRAVAELYSEYSFVLRRHRIHLLPAALLLFDSDTRWGQWDPLTRTIRIARKLVQNHPWFQVLAVLRHEMAHQLLEETSPEHLRYLLDDRPHGERFRWACQKLGVPEEFSRASADLQESNLDWRTEKRDEASEKLLDKARKLLALATSPNEHEALLAMNKVRELYAKYNLEEAASQREEDFAHLVICHGKKRIEGYQDMITGILVGHFFVQVLTFKTFDPKTGERHRAIEVIGRRENVLMAEYVYHFLIQQTDFLVDEKTKTGTRLSRVERNSYRLGILEGFQEKLLKSEQKSEPASVSASSLCPASSTNEVSLIGQALVAFRKDHRLDEYVHGCYPRLGRSAGSYATIDDAAFSDGRIAGQTITLNKAVSEAGGNRGRLLAKP